MLMFEELENYEIEKQLAGEFGKGKNVMTKVSPMKNKKNQAKTIRIDRKRTRKDQDLAMQADRNSKRADQLIECESDLN